MHQYLFFVFLLSVNLADGRKTAQADNTTISFDTYCGLNHHAAALAELIINHSGQQRDELKCHPMLAVTAAEKAKIMAQEQRIQHNLNQMSPNQLLEKYGYLLPDKYPTFGNQVESIAGGYKNPEKALRAYLDSEGHRIHILSEHVFYQHQIHLGVGYFYDPNTPNEHHWVVHIAAPQNNGNKLPDDVIIADIKNMAYASQNNK